MAVVHSSLISQEGTNVGEMIDVIEAFFVQMLFITRGVELAQTKQPSPTGNFFFAFMNTYATRSDIYTPYTNHVALHPFFHSIAYAPLALFE